MPTVDFYSKGQTDSLLSAKADSSDLPSSSQLVPSTSGASSGDVLTFNGSSTEWAAPGGSGGDWIEIDVSNMPTNFTNGEIIRLGLMIKPSYTGSPPTGWSSAVNVTPTIAKDNQPHIFEFMIMSGSNTETRQLISQDNLYSMNMATFLKGNTTAGDINGVNAGSSSYSLFNIEVIAYNGGSTQKQATVQITKADLSTYVRLWRKSA